MSIKHTLWQKKINWQSLGSKGRERYEREKKATRLEKEYPDKIDETTKDM